MSTGTRRGLLSFAGVLAMVLALIAPQAAVAQAGGSKALITGETVAWTAEWTHEPEIGGGDAQFELLVLSRGGSLVAVGGTSFAASSTEVRDLVIEGFASDGTLRQIDRGDYDNVSYSIDISTTDNVSIALFTLVIENPNATSIYVLISDPPAFQGAMESAQAAVTVNGSPIFDGVDAAVMQQTINAAVPSLPASGAQTNPVPQSNNGLTSQEETYLAAVDADRLEISTILLQLAPKFQQLAQDPTVVLDTTWKVGLAGPLAQWQAVSERAATYQPSERQQHIHSIWLAVSNLNLQTVDDIVRSIDNIDASALEQANARMTYTNLMYGDLHAAIESFRANPNAPFTPLHAISPVLGCKVFPNYEEAQLYYAAYPEEQSIIDPDLDGLACEDHFGRG